MTPKKKLLQPSNAEIAERFGLSFCVAGGYAACPSLAGDQDVWFYGIHKDDLEDTREGLLRAYNDIEPEENPSRDSVNADGSMNVDEVEQGYLGACYTLKVGTLAGGRHLLVTAANTISELLDGFDISTHQCAINASGEFVMGNMWTPLWEPPVILRDGGIHTPERFKKISDRYAFLRKEAA